MKKPVLWKKTGLLLGVYFVLDLSACSIYGLGLGARSDSQRAALDNYPGTVMTRLTSGTRVAALLRNGEIQDLIYFTSQNREARIPL